jgi:hypothetical protein
MYYWTHKNGRYYAAIISQDLFGFWTVLKVWGGAGRTESQTSIIACDSPQSALQEVANIAATRRQHGYLMRQPLHTMPKPELAAN